MCGIFCACLSKEFTNGACADILTGLKRLEYRGYDSCGISTIYNNAFLTIKKIGEVNAVRLDKDYPISGNIGIGHTRWATHSAVTVHNTHPQIFGKVSVVHNGIVENLTDIIKFIHDNNFAKIQPGSTDTYVIPVLISLFINRDDLSFPDACIRAFNMLKGNSAVAAICSSENQIFCTTSGTPLYLGKNEEDFYISSDSYALNNCPFIYSIKPNNYILLRPNSALFFDLTKTEQNCSESEIEGDASSRLIPFEVNDVDSNLNDFPLDSTEYEHITLKEIHEQKLLIPYILRNYLNDTGEIIQQQLLDILQLDAIDKIYIVGSGSSYNASLIISHQIREVTDIEINVELGSEFAYMKHNFGNYKNIVAIFISQSGETMDSIIGIRSIQESAKKSNCDISTIGIINNLSSTIARMVDYPIHCRTTKEIGVAATKSFTSQLIVGRFLALLLAKASNFISDGELRERCLEMIELRDSVGTILNSDKEIRKLAKKVSQSKNILFIGRGLSFGVATEACLKMKELSYISSDAIYAGELKHGHLALIDKDVFSVAVLLDDHLKDKTISNIHEIRTRNGKLIVISTNRVVSSIKSQIPDIDSIAIPDSNITSAIVLLSIVGQLLAYYTALELGRSIDKPRNLSKSITVE